MGKIYTVTMPDIGEGVVEGEVINWLKQLNDPVAQDEPVVILMTDKATVELPSPYVGKLVKQYYQVGQIAIKDKPLYDIEVTAEQHTIEKLQPEKKPTPIARAPESPKPSKEHHKALAAPPTRKLAKELGIDINSIEGSGPEGRVLKTDLKQSKANKPTLNLFEDEEKPLVGIHKLMAKSMAASHAEIPPFSYFEQVDATRLVQMRQSFKEKAAEQGISVTFMPFIIKALSLTLTQFPKVNSSLDMDRNTLILHKPHNVGIAISTSNGLIVPVLKNVESMALQEIIMAFNDLKERAATNKLLPSDMKEATISITNFGVLGGGGLWATPIINYPEAAILGIARIQKLPIVRNDEIVIRDVLNLSWSFDHRVVNGEEAAEFSHHFSTLLQNPAPLL